MVHTSGTEALYNVSLIISRERPLFPALSLVLALLISRFLFHAPRIAGANYDKISPVYASLALPAKNLFLPSSSFTFLLSGLMRFYGDLAAIKECAHTYSTFHYCFCSRGCTVIIINFENCFEKGYRLAYRRHHEQARRTEEDVREVKIDDPSIIAHEIKGLRQFTRYD